MIHQESVHKSEFAIAAAKVVNEIYVTLVEKNLKYGNSALDPVRIFSKADVTEQLRVRIDDKLSRLVRGNPDQDDEDVILDLIGYLVMLTIAERSGTLSETHEQEASSDEEFAAGYPEYG